MNLQKLESVAYSCCAAKITDKTAIVVLLAIAIGSDDGTCETTIPELARRAHRSEQEVSDAIRLLGERGVLNTTFKDEGV
jgi:hypothetical protein